MAGITAEEAKKRLLNMSEEELKERGEQTVILALVIIRSAVDIMLIEHISKMNTAEDGLKKVFFKTFNPLVEDFESDKHQEAFNRAFNIFAKENPTIRMATMENILQAAMDSLHKFGELVETGKDFADEKLQH